MDAPRTPEEETILQLHAENVSIIEKLLGWKRASDGVPIWLKPATETRREEQWYTPSFTSWAEAGLILDAFAKLGQRPDVCTYDGKEWTCLIDATDFDPVPVVADTGPLAIRAAALEYIRSLP